MLHVKVKMIHFKLSHNQEMEYEMLRTSQRAHFNILA